MKIAPLLLVLISSSIGLAEAADNPCRPAIHARVPAIVNLTYHKARKALLAKGWQPLQTRSSNDASTEPDLSSGNGALFWGKGYREVESCAGTGLAPCAFLFKDAHGNRLRVTTAGEELPKEKAHAIVTGFQFVCP